MSIRSDNFNRADSATALGTPSDAGSAWVEGGLSSLFGIASDQAYVVNSSGYDLAWLEASQSDCTVQVTLALATSLMGVCCRVVDNANYWWCGFDASGGATFYISKIVAGAQTVANSVVGTASNGDVLSVVLSGSSFALKKNGTTVLSASDAFNSTATKHGIWNHNSSATTSRWDDFSIAANAAASGGQGQLSCLGVGA